MEVTKPVALYEDYVDLIDRKLRLQHEQLAHLAQQKELHSEALKEMYQAFIKLDGFVREETTRLNAETEHLKHQLAIERRRTATLAEIVKGLWQIVETIDPSPESQRRLHHMSTSVEDLSALEAVAP